MNKSRSEQRQLLRTLKGKTQIYWFQNMRVTPITISPILYEENPDKEEHNCDLSRMAFKTKGKGKLQNKL